MLEEKWDVKKKFKVTFHSAVENKSKTLLDNDITELMKRLDHKCFNNTFF